MPSIISKPLQFSSNEYSCRYLPRFLRQRHRQGHRRHRMASPAGIRLHPLLRPRRRHLLLPRVAPLAHEARKDRQGLRVHEPPPRPPHHRRSRLLLLSHHLRGGAQGGRRRWLLLPSVGLLPYPPNQARKLRCLHCHACPADVRNQQYVSLYELVIADGLEHSILTRLVVISFYSSTIFEEAGYLPTEALYASLGYGAIQVVSTIPTLFLIDTKGRRTLTLAVSFPRLAPIIEMRLLIHRSIDLPWNVHLPACCWSFPVEDRRYPC